ncbi:hypothetical protein TDCHD05_10455 [Tenacibaculum dicentrarchi]|nr:hypothetical protein TDCHD05_10455 [Tenacibaculum dicentrarchi]
MEQTAEQTAEQQQQTPIQPKKKAGRPKGVKNPPYEVSIRNAIAKRVTTYFTSQEFIEDFQLGKTGSPRRKLHMELLPYVITKKESIKSLLVGLSPEETEQLGKIISSEL